MGVIMGSVTDIVNMISLVLIAFVSISLVVSSIMIGIITYISVLERKKEIGILRAIGASKGNVASVFNAETFIEGLISGLFAIAVVVAVSVPPAAATRWRPSGASDGERADRDDADKGDRANCQEALPDSWPCHLCQVPSPLSATSAGVRVMLSG